MNHAVMKEIKKVVFFKRFFKYFDPFSPSAFCSYCNHFLSIFPSLILHIDAPSISCINYSEHLSKIGRRAAVDSLYPALRAPSLRLLHSVGVHCYSGGSQGIWELLHTYQHKGLKCTVLSQLYHLNCVMKSFFTVPQLIR